eukprot:CAMPEP_0185779314 /NCGR_PEP_ID=MMETSP1174-20130828/95444_1 /TAXON_ID=35687 /ORGANISM="Dictyocha speculum, Strain CCMP1381" /LENGTH=67 /DNA_ID=CAMNT_0028468413 /DNA_START=301 /DNA_END=504 /DNA_ORIENTATION=-
MTAYYHGAIGSVVVNGGANVELVGLLQALVDNIFYMPPAPSNGLFVSGSTCFSKLFVHSLELPRDDV